MRVIICGAGQVGSTIAQYLSQEEGTIVTLIDNNPDVIRRINNTMEVRAILGHASHPDTLAEADAQDADMIIAVTSMDEVNMIACQMAHTLFDIPKKIARLRHQNYLNKQYSDVFTAAHMPIDYIMSPELEVVRAIERRLAVPGAADVIGLAKDKVYVLGILAGNSPLVGQSIQSINLILKPLDAQVISVIRNGETRRGEMDLVLESEDITYVFVKKEHLEDVMKTFGHQEKEAHRILISGGNNIGTRLLENINDTPGMSARLIEYDADRAGRIALKIPKSTILHGNLLDAKFLSEIGIRNTDTFVAITDDDEFNIMSSLLVKRHHCPRVITLLNTATYEPLVAQLGIDVTINPRSLTVSHILQHMRLRRLKSIYSVQDDFGEIMELEVLRGMTIFGKTVKSLKLSKNIQVLAQVRGNSVILNPRNEPFEEGDLVILYASHTATAEVTKKFSSRNRMM